MSAVVLETAPHRPAPLSVEGARRLAGSIALVAAAFVQAPGWTSADTKIDLYVDPWGFLGRALHLWDPATASGSLQNQAFGYLFPQGPFYGVLESLGVAPWVAQRLWWALILVVAFNGAIALLRAMGVGTPATRIIGALVFALSPRIVSALGQVSSEVWPMAMAPWVLAPLVRQGLAGGDPRRAAARSAVAFLCVGAVNAVASIAVLVLPLLYLATRRRSRDVLRLALWWFACVALVSLWWFVALVVLGRYSPPFLDWIESSSVTTAPGSVANALRGTTAWLPYLSGGRGPAWPAGWMLVTQPVLILDTGILAALGVAGLAWRGLRERLFLVSGAVVGVLLLSVAWSGPASSPLAGAAQTFLDGAGAPLRNVHKFDPVLRVVLLVGLTHLISTLRLRPLRQARWVSGVGTFVAVFALLGAFAPVLTGQVGAGPRFDQVPEYWRQAADWLNTEAVGERTLVVPGSQPSAYLWGGTGDDILQPLLDQPWAERDGVPLGSAGNTRFLDAVERVLGTGTGSPGLSAYLSRSGVSFVVARNDLDWARLGTASPTVVHASLEASGLLVAASFGPPIGASRTADVVIDGGLGIDLPAVEIWAVPDSTGPVTRAVTTRVVAGGPEDLLRLSEDGLRADTAVVLAADAPTSPVDVVTDGYRRREVNFGNSRANSSATMTAADSYLVKRKVHDYWPVPPDGNQSVATFDDGEPHASTSGATAIATHNRSNGYGPAQAFDGDPRTEWRPSSSTPVGQWVSLEGFAERPLGLVTVTVDTSASLAQVQHVDVTAGGTTVDATVDRDGVATADLTGVVADSVRVTVTAIYSGDKDRSVAIRDVALGASTAREVVPARAISSTSSLVAAVPQDRRTACVHVDGRVLCSKALASPGEEDYVIARQVDVSSTTTGTLRLRARPVSSPLVDALLQPIGDAISASATSTLVPEVEVRAQAAVDLDPATTWVASVDDKLPALTLRLPRAATVTGLRLVEGPDAPTSPATSVSLTFDGTRQVTADVGSDGAVAFPAEQATTIEISPVALHRRTSLDPRTALVSTLPWGVSEVVVEGADDGRHAIDPAAATGTACGFGPDLVIDGVTTPTRVVGTLGDLEQDRPMSVIPCGSKEVTLSTGPHHLRLVASDGFVPDQLGIVQAGSTAPPVSKVLLPEVTSWSATARTVDVAAASTDTLLIVHENASTGWTATLGGRTLAPVRVDGWQQAWRIPAGASGEVHLEFGPDRLYRAGLLIGVLSALAVLFLALRRPRTVAGPLAARTVPSRATAVAPVVLGGLLGGVVGLVIGVLVAVPLRRVAGTRPEVLGTVAGGAAAAAALVAAVRPWPAADYGAGSLAAQVFALVAVTVLVARPRPVALADQVPQPHRSTLDDVPGDGGDRHGHGELDTQDQPEPA